jgi:hypothetical protein
VNYWGESSSIYSGVEDLEVASSRVLGTLQAGRLVNSPEPLACVHKATKALGHKVIRFSI